MNVVIYIPSYVDVDILITCQWKRLVEFRYLSQFVTHWVSCATYCQQASRVNTLSLRWLSLLPQSSLYTTFIVEESVFLLQTLGPFFCWYVYAPQLSQSQLLGMSSLGSLKEQLACAHAGFRKESAYLPYYDERYIKG